MAGRLATTPLRTAALGPIFLYTVSTTHGLPWAATGEWAVARATRAAFLNGPAAAAGGDRPAVVRASDAPTYEADGAKSVLDYAVAHWPVAALASSRVSCTISP